MLLLMNLQITGESHKTKCTGNLRTGNSENKQRWVTSWHHIGILSILIFVRRHLYQKFNVKTNWNASSLSKSQDSWVFIIYTSEQWWGQLDNWKIGSC